MQAQVFTIPPMRNFATARAWALGLFLLLVTGVAATVGWFAYTSALTQLAARGQADLSLASDRLVAQLQRFRQVAVLMADHPELVQLSKGQGAAAEVSALLLTTADKTGAVEILLAGRNGEILASSSKHSTIALGGQAHFERAMRGALGTSHVRNATSNQRVFFFAAPILRDGGVLGAVVVAVDMEAVEESDWRGDLHAVFFTDSGGMIFVANRSELVLRSRMQADGTAVFNPKTTSHFGGYDIWSINSGPYIPSRALHLTKPLPIIGMTGEILLDIAPARRLAWLQAAAVAALMLAFGAVLFWLSERRRALAELLKIEAKAKGELEARVVERTHELKQAQADLVQAGKLSALGQMSAGISHELNQPLMAIQQYAVNGAKFLQRGNGDMASENLDRIDALSTRMARIIKNLRAFSRNESEPMGKVDLVAVLNTAVELTAVHLKDEGVTLEWQAGSDPALEPVYVLGGEVRLVQVFVNLINNAADAMSNQQDRLISLAIETGEKPTVFVRDIGPGIKDSEKIFEPFYSTKTTGSSEGMGLGLSISYGLVQSFGGNIRGTNAPNGAVFTVELEYWKEPK